MRSINIYVCLLVVLLITGRTVAQDRSGSGGRFGEFLEPLRELDLSPRQKMELGRVVQSFRRSMSGEFKDKQDSGNPNREERVARIDALKREAYEKALVILTPDQRLQLMGASQEIDSLLGKGSGKSLDPELLKRAATLTGRAGDCTPLPPNAVDSVLKPKYNPCNDAVFVRRVYVDLIGTTPTVTELLDFMADDHGDKRRRLVDELMQRVEYADYQAMHWCDVLRVKSEFPIKLWPNGAAVYHRWIRDAMRTNMPFNEFARTLLTASGSNFRNPPSNFYRAVQGRDSHGIAEAVALTFLGQRIEYWSERQLDEFAKCFSCIAYKPTSEWKEEIVYWNRKIPETATATLPDGAVLAFSPGNDPRLVFADWLVSDENRWFVPVAVNRFVYWMFGRGIVNEPDDFRSDNPPVNPALLKLLTQEFIKSGYDIRALYRLLATSRVYQQENPGYPVRPLDAETLQDTFCRVFGTHVGYKSEVPEPFSYYPPRLSTVSLPDGGLTSPLLQTFGRPSRDTGKESDRERNVTEEQRMFFINSTELNGWIEKSWMLRVLPLDEKHRTDSLRYLWLEVLSRFPTQEELVKAGALLSAAESPSMESVQDLLWMLINMKEFASKH